MTGRSAGSYAIREIDVAAPPAVVRPRDGDTGVALVFRAGGLPVGFTMLPLAPGELIDGPAIAALIRDVAGPAMLAAAIHDELRRSSEPLPTPPSLTVAVCTRDRSDCLPRCLEALVRVLRPGCPDGPGSAARGPIELLVVDNAPSDDRTAGCVAVVPGVRYVREPLPGLDFARNRALAEATGDYVAFVDDDAVMDDGWYDGFVAAWRRDPEAAAITGLVLPLELETEAQRLFEARGGFRRGFARLRYAGDTLAGNRLYPAGAGIFGAGCNMVLRRSVMQRLGGFDEALDVGTPTQGGGDLDIFYRILRAGHALLYEPAQLVMHQHRREMAQLRRQYWTWGSGFMSFVVKSWRDDRAARPRLAGVVWWWFRNQLREIALSTLGRHPLPARLLVAELRGGISGLAGTYPRSVRAVRRRRLRA